MMSTLQIMDFLKIPDSSFMWLSLGVPGAASMLVSTEILWVDNLVFLFLTLLIGIPIVVGAFQMMDGFSDPPKAIERLEERIRILRSKGSPKGST
jgi:hypothetical protein